MTEPRFAVGLSFSSSQREFISQVAECLRLALGGKNAVLYDAFHEAEFSRSDLPAYLTELYLSHTTLNVAFVSQEYQDGNWTGLEADTLTSLIVAKQKDRLMLFNFAAAKLKHLPWAGYIGCEGKYPTGVASLILERYEALVAAEQAATRDVAALDNQSSLPSSPKSLHLPRAGVFVGRRDELSRVLDSLRPETRTWGCVIAGPGGIGKTSLAIRAAESVDSRVFDDVIFVSAKHADLTPEGIRLKPGLRVSDAIEMFKEAGRQLGSGGRSWAPVRDRVAEFLASLRNRKTLLVFDNLETLPNDDRQVVLETLRQLPNGCKAIVTSRIGYRTEACLVDLRSLPEEDSRALLDEIGVVNPLLSSATEKERDEMVDRCGGNPLILKWTLGQLGQGDSRTLGNALARLADRDRHHDPIKFVFEGMADNLASPQRTLLATLSIIGKPVASTHLGELLDIPSIDVHQSLQGLVKRMLVLTNKDDVLFWLPPLAGHYVERVMPDTVAQQKILVCDYVVDLFAKHGAERYRRDAVIDQHWEIVQAALPQLCSLPSNRLQQFCDSSRNYLLFNGHWDERRVLALAGEQAALATNDFGSAFRRAYDVGMVHYRRGETESVVALSDRVEAHATALEDPREGVALAMRLRSLGLRDRNELDSAIAVGGESIALFESLGRSKDYACALNALGVTLRLAGDLEGSENYCLQGLAVAREVGNKEYEADYVGNLADVPLDRGQWGVAREQAEEALRLSTAIGRQDLIARNEFRLARIDYGAADYEKAAAHAETALRLYGELGMPQAKQIMEFLGLIVAR